MRATIGAQASDGALTTLAGLSLAAGDVLYATGADTVARLAIGTAGQVLQVNSGATAPEWATRPGALVYSARQATTSGTQFDFGSIPSTATEIEIYFDQVSLNGADDMLVQLGTSGGFVTSGYVSYSNDATSYTTGMGVRAAVAARLGLGTMFLRKIENDIWHNAHTINFGGTNTTGGGRVDLGGTLTQIRVTRLGATTFDNGAVSIAWRS